MNPIKETDNNNYPTQKIEKLRKEIGGGKNNYSKSRRRIYRTR